MPAEHLRTCSQAEHPRTCSQAEHPRTCSQAEHPRTCSQAEHPRTCSQAEHPRMCSQAEHLRTCSQDHAKFPCPKLNKSISTPPHCYLQVRRCARFHPPAPEQLRFSLCWVVTRCVLVAGCHVAANHPVCRITEGPMTQDNFNIIIICIQVYFQLSALLFLNILHVSTVNYSHPQGATNVAVIFSCSTLCHILTHSMEQSPS